ncbi:hypothetical protein [uncultured Chitinophaga sp.]|uniref:hypothetical protein n=1 Tax=uncultured Chitinophaga sp. TaxID=339340 RepID=UPI0025E64A77|nr:hypothetical protein [uncultured Chitinophaga sp.]
MKFKLLLACLAAYTPVFSQHLLLEEDPGYVFSKSELADSITKKKCISYSIITKRKLRDAMTVPGYFINVLYFPDNKIARTTTTPANTLKVQQLIDAVPPMQELLSVGIIDYSVPYRKNYQLDSVLYVREGGQLKELSGVVVMYTYVLKPYSQAINLATNNYFVNTKAKKTKISFDNGVPYIVDKFMDGDYQNKLFLIDETKDGHYHFLRTARFCRDCAYSEKEVEFIFDVAHGVTRVKTFVPELSASGFKSGSVYYNFK